MEVVSTPIQDPRGTPSGGPVTSLPVIPSGTPPGVPQVPTGNQSGDRQVENGNGRTTTGNSSAASPPRPVRLSEVKEKLLRPSLTSNFQCWFNPPQKVREKVGQYYDAELISLLCSEASLPGSSLATNEVNDDFTGVTERFAYRKQYDDRADFTFYVDYGRQNGSYNLILFFEEWIRYAVNETPTAEENNYFYRVNFPDDYRSQAIYINKFERDFKGDYLEYKFLKAYPISMTSMPVSYDSSELLKCTVSFTYTRYVLRRKKNSIEGEPGQVTPAGIPDVGFPENPQPRIDPNQPQLPNLNQNPLSNRRTLGTNPGDVNPGSGGDVPPVTGDLQLF
jgi:hypothetical protein